MERKERVISMENYAKKIAITHNISGKASIETFPKKTILESFKAITATNRLLNECIALDVTIPPGGEWLLDNYYLLEEQVNGFLTSLKERDYCKLPAIHGQARSWFVAKELVTFTDGNVTAESIITFLNAYQIKRNMEMREIWMFPFFLKLALLQAVQQVCDRMYLALQQKLKVESLMERLVKKIPSSEQRFSRYKNWQVDSEATTYVEHLTYCLKKLGKEGSPYLEILEDEVKRVGTTVSDVIRVEHYDVTLQRVSIANAITSIRQLARLNWSDIFAKTNRMDQILQQDSWYERLDFETKAEYRNAIQSIADQTRISESYIANKVIEIAKGEHIGIFLLGEKKADLYHALGVSYREEKHPLFWYLFAIYAPTLLISYAACGPWFWLAWIPVSEIFVLVVNRIVAKKTTPRILPRLEVIDPKIQTFVIVPTLLQSPERVKEMMENLEVYYLGNQTVPLYFALLGDASETSQEVMEYDTAIMRMGQAEAKRLNEKYGKEIFFFLYRKRTWNPQQGTWLGYERKRGMICEFNRFLLYGEPGTFQMNTISHPPAVQYVITLDADTMLPMDTAKKLIGIMEHPMHHPVVEQGIVTKGYGLVQPKVGVSIQAATKSMFSKMFAGSGGLDIYSTAESNVYQDLFGEAIFTGKGIYHLRVFQEVLEGQIPENTVLSHDLLEGAYLRCGLATDVEMIDGFPSQVNAYMARQQRWIRGDWQILRWLGKGPLRALSKYQIWDNLRRSLVPIFTFLLFLTGHIPLACMVLLTPLLLDVLDCVLQTPSPSPRGVARYYLPIIEGIQGSCYRAFFQLLMLPYQWIANSKAILKTWYRMAISKRHLLEWLTAADAEKLLGKRLRDYLREFGIGFWGGVLLCLLVSWQQSELLPVAITFTILWALTPWIAYGISLPETVQSKPLRPEEIKFLEEVANRTWQFFADYMTEENHYLPPDNYQEKRKEPIVTITSCTNIGLGLLAILSAYDFSFLSEAEMVERLEKSLQTMASLETWNGHLYNWYHIRTLEPVTPKFVSTVDSGNLVGYLYAVKLFLQEKKEEKTPYQKQYESMYRLVCHQIEEADFSKLYDASKNLFSMGFDAQENALVDSYYDLLASEARQASFIAIAKRDIPYKHWFYLGRTLTTVNGKKGLISWAGTMFEYFMPTIVMESYRYTLLDETYDFCLASQKEYAKRLHIPWGMSEAAFNLMDLNYQYQYKAFGIPWLGVKRGLKDEIVVSPYSSFLTIGRDPKGVIQNSKELVRLGVYQKYGFYESIDYTPNRTEKGNYALVRTYMAHHQGLLLASLNNYLHSQILVRRFSNNPEIKMASFLLEEKVPQQVVYTHEKKEKVKAIQYKDHEDYQEVRLDAKEEKINVLSNEQYTLIIDTKGRGYSEWRGKRINRFKEHQPQTNFFYIKQLQTGECWSNFLTPAIKPPDESFVVFSSAIAKFMRRDGDIDTITKIAVSPEDNIEIRQLELENTGKEPISLEILSYLDPVLCDVDTDITFPAFHKLFFFPERYQQAILFEKRERDANKKNPLLLVAFWEEGEEQGMEVETDKMKLVGQHRSLEKAWMVGQDCSYSQEVFLSTDAVVSFKKRIHLEPGEKRTLVLAMGVSEQREEIEEYYQKMRSNRYWERSFELAVSKSFVENRFLRFPWEEIAIYHQIIQDILYGSATRKQYVKRIRANHLQQKDLWPFGISGDLPIILVRVKHPNEMEMVKRLVRAMEYFHRKHFAVDLILLDDEKNSYEQYTWERILETINGVNLNYLLHQRGGIHPWKHSQMTEEEVNLFYACSDIILDAHDGRLEEQVYENGRMVIS